MAYWPLPGKVLTQDSILKRYRKKIILLSVIQENKLIARQFRGIQYLRNEGDLAIFEPVGDPFENLNGIDMVIVPGCI